MNDPEIELNAFEAQDVIAAVHIEKKIQDLDFANVAYHQVDIARSNHRQGAFKMMTPAARAFTEKALAKMGILKSGIEPADPHGLNVMVFLDGGAAAA